MAPINLVSPRLRIGALAAALLALPLCACDRQAAERGNEAANAVAGNTAVAAPVPLLAADDAAKRASVAAFGKSASFQQNGETYDYVEHKLVNTPFGPVLLSKADAVDGSHASSGILSATYLKADGAGYTVVRRFPVAVESGSFGAFSQWAVRDDLGTNPVAEVQGGGMWQGYSCSWTSFTELTPQGPVELVGYQNGFDDSGANEDKPSSIESKIAKVVPGKSFTVHFSGTRTFDATYERRQNKYVLIGGEDHALDGC